jgi:CubicO group peptidase (beta-lactamase class C family)
MKRITLLITLTLASLTLASHAREIPVVAPERAGLSETKLAGIEQFMQQEVAEQKLAGGIVIISHQGKIGFFHTYGLMDREAQKPMSPDTIFRIYSMSKAITTTAALTLYDAGKLGLDDPVSKYIPSFAKLMVATTNGLRPPSRHRCAQGRLLTLEADGIHQSRGDGGQAFPSAAGVRPRHRLALWR